jgi:uncharacterized damage-inducible protein DinB
LHIAAQNLYFLEQGRQLLATLDDELFSREGRTPRSASVGTHLRHIIDCFRCFLRGLKSDRIDYDARQRHPRIETNRATAEAALAEIVASLAALEGTPASRLLEVKVDADAWADPNLHWHGSTLGRELQFLLSHTVHHYALIALILRGHGHEPPADFGVAPSTLEHERSALKAATPCVR